VFLLYIIVDLYCYTDRGNSKLHLAAGSKQALLSRNRAPSSSSKKTLGKTTNIFCTHSAAGVLIHAAIQVVVLGKSDHPITKWSIKPELSVWCLEDSADQERFFIRLQKECILPIIKQCKDELAMKLRNNLHDPFLPSVESSSDSLGPPGGVPVLHYDHDNVPTRSLMTFDGDATQIKAYTKPNSILLSIAAEQSTEVVKWAAAASMVEQPADVGPCHKVLHQDFSAVFSGQSTLVAVQSAEMNKWLKENFDSPTFQSLLKSGLRPIYRIFFEYVEVILNRAFTLSNIAKSWCIPGYIPHNVNQIFSQFSGWRDVPNAEATIILGYV
jgi:hypothetical protein